MIARFLVVLACACFFVIGILEGVFNGAEKAYAPLTLAWAILIYIRTDVGFSERKEPQKDSNL